MKCIWCANHEVQESTKDCHWVMPDGKRAVIIQGVPAHSCEHCGTYLAEEMNQKVENLLYFSDLAAYPNQFTFGELVSAPKIEIYKLLKQG